MARCLSYEAAVSGLDDGADRSPGCALRREEVQVREVGI
jgi:hypothetical protein